MSLTPEQVDALRAVPLGAMPNKLRIALALAKVKQIDVVNATGIAAPNVSDFVRGAYRDLNLETARKLADFFGCEIGDLFPSRETIAS
jgi:DNA-binding Xre family transcriptional regulator